MLVTGSGSSPVGRSLLPPGQIVREVNLFLRGWAGYSGTGTPHPCWVRSGIMPFNGSRRGCPNEATGVERGDGA